MTATDQAGEVAVAYRRGQEEMRERAAHVCDQRGVEEQEGYGLNRAAQNYFRARNAVRDLPIAALATQTATGRTMGGEEHRCSICGGKSFAALDVRQYDGTFAPGPERRCVECKTLFTAQQFAALQNGGE